MFKILSQTELEALAPNTAAGTASQGSVGDLYVTRETGDMFAWNPVSRSLMPVVRGGMTTGVGDVFPKASAMAILGDSYHAAPNNYSGTVLWSINANSPFQALNGLLGGPWDLVYDGSVSGTKSSDWVSSQLAGVLASATSVVFFGLTGKNMSHIKKNQNTRNAQKSLWRFCF
jgi:hypothetical protein